jgi:hypothetical protein
MGNLSILCCCQWRFGGNLINGVRHVVLAVATLYEGQGRCFEGRCGVEESIYDGSGVRSADGACSHPHERKTVE